MPQLRTLSPRARLLLTIAVIAIGLVIAGFFGIRTVTSARQLQYIRQQGLDRGSASVDAIRPWTTVRGPNIFPPASDGLAQHLRSV